MTLEERLRHLASAILDDATPAYACGPEVALLADLLRAHAPVQIDPDRVRSDGEVRTAHGLALSPTMAGRCADDIARTVVFARGVHAAVREARAARPHTTVSLLYAGCGPYALLAIPAMALRGPQELRITLLDINEASIASARAVLAALGLTYHVDGFVVADACRYQIPADRRPDLILSETMNACLEREPQVAIARHLLRQAPAAALVPRSVRVDARLIDTAKEFAFVDTPNRPSVSAERGRTFLGEVFELSAETIASWPDAERDRLPAATIRIPRPLARGYVPRLFTTVVVHPGHVLRAYDSGLTLPTPIPYYRALRGAETLDFHYRLGPTPGLACEVTTT